MTDPDQMRAMAGRFDVHAQTVEDEARRMWASSQNIAGAGWSGTAQMTSRSFCANEFADDGLNSSVAQTNICFHHTPGTLRSLHRQKPPYAEAKLVRCTRGAIVDVAVDVRPESRTYCKHVIVQRRQPPGTVRAAVFRTWLPDPGRQHRNPSAGAKHQLHQPKGK
jgi:hypothetical protein